MKTKDRFFVDSAIRYLNQMQDDPEWEAVGLDVMYDTRGEITVNVRFQHAPKKEEKPASSKTEEAPEALELPANR